MWFRSILKSLRFSGKASTRPAQRDATKGKPTALKPFIESLEERTVPTFVAAVPYAVGPAPQAMVTADFNNDNIQDLAVANYSDSTVSVLLGVGDGTFAAALTSPTGSSPVSLAVGDFNSDGTMDLATANAYDVTVLLGIEDASGDGTGTFESPASTSLPYYQYPQSVAVGDFNGDGLLDLGVTSNYYYNGWSGYANVLQGDGAGGFSGPYSTWLGYGYHNVAVAANLNGDAADDFVTFNQDYQTVNILLGDSSGYLSYYSDLYTGDYSYSVAAGKVNGDGATDLVTANFNGNSVGVFLGDGSGGFSATGNFDVGGYPSSVVIGDFTGDSKPDVATANAYTNQMAVLYGDGNGALSTPVFSNVGTTPWAIAAGYFNSDTWLDAATANNGGNDVSVLINDQIWPDPPPPPPPHVSITNATVTEGVGTSSTTATFTLTLSYGYATPITVHYETADGSGPGSATAGSDYTAASFDVTFAPYQTTMDISITVLGDRSAEPTETFVVNLSSSDAFIGDGQGLGTIVDNEPRVSINDRTVTEGDSGSVTTTFTVTLSVLYDEPVIVPYTLANGTAASPGDYTASSGTVTIPANSISNTLPVQITGDLIAEPTENFFVNLSAPPNGAISDAQGVGTILDNDIRIRINDVSLLEGNGNANGKGNDVTLFVFTVSLSGPASQVVTVNYSTSNGTASGDDYVAKGGTLTFAAGETSKTVTIVVYRDKKKEANETFFVNLSGANNATIDDAQGVGTIRNDD